MKILRAFLSLILTLALCAAVTGALAAGLDDPESYLGTWEGGENYGEAREYYLELLDYSDGVYTAGLDIYRIWGFEGLTALVTEDAPSAILSTRVEDDYTVLAALDFTDSTLTLVVLDSDFPDLTAETEIRFTRSALD